MPSSGEAAVLLAAAKKDVTCQRGDAAVEAAKAALAVCTSLADQDKIIEASFMVARSMIANDDSAGAVKTLDELKPKVKDSPAWSALLQLVNAEAQIGSRSYGLVSSTIPNAPVGTKAHLKLAPWANVKDAAAALSSASLAFKSFESLGDKSGMGMALLAMGKARFAMNEEKQQSMLDAQKALAVFNEVGDECGEASAWELLSDVRFRLNANEGGMAAAGAAMALYLEAGDAAGEARVLLALADQAGWDMRIGRNMPASAGEALAAAVKALAQFHKDGSYKLEVIALDLAVKAHCALGQTFEASQAAKQTVASMRRLGKQNYEALAMLALAHAHAAEEWQSEALEVVNNAFSVLEDVAKKARNALTITSLAKASQCKAKLNFSESRLEAALEAAEGSSKLFTEVSADPVTLADASELVQKIKDSIQKNPGLQAELEKKKDLQRDLELQTLNEVAEALQLRKEEQFKVKYEKLGECALLSEDEINATLAPIVQADYDATQKWIGSALGTDKQERHQYLGRDFAYYISRMGGMHYGPGFRLNTVFGNQMPFENPYMAMYSVMQLHNQIREEEWELSSLYHPPMYDCGLQSQMAGNGIQPGPNDKWWEAFQ